MTDKNKADQSASHKKTHTHDTSSTAQRSRLLGRLRLQPVDTITARSELNTMMPAARAKELHDRGHDICRHLITLTDDYGRTHNGIALYFLGTNTTPAQAEV
ncbi:helix-turn-helix domain-containing protein [Pseudomonas borbori]|uniref:Helix-turn-helix domain-containing protein n=1 Tax=Pseudomonas borbori TaxID=289003 RepID=A0A1I5VK51_9PSED|nr:helix-turn-helix domain-containing protein [Pseudomonas borbori]SFQ07849.1 Helix-turn-helix domain-containing protein [Pseudomonas borbori]